MSKIRVGVVLGGRSGEHEVSLESARSVIGALDRSRYDVAAIGINRDGTWLLQGDPLAILRDDSGEGDKGSEMIAPSTGNAMLSISGHSSGDAGGAIDIVLPILHGPYGEDGTIQGMLEMADIPYVGSGVLGSAAGMDKGIMKAVFKEAGLPTARYRLVTAREWGADRDGLSAEITPEVGYPLFVKPANLGSSVGITKVHDRDELGPAVDLAATYDRRVIVEEAIEDAREIECAVLGNDDPIASVCGEVFAAGEFYDYASKYEDNASRTEAPADLPESISGAIREMSVRAFKALDCAGLARVDFLVRQSDQAIFVIEANTMPGFTEISMYPKLWEASSLPYPELLDRLIELGFERHRQRAELRKGR